MRTPIQTDAAPQAIGPYSQAIRVDRMVYTSGQLGLDPKEMRLVSDDAEGQTRQILRNLEQVLAASGASLSDVVKTTIFMTDLKEFASVNRCYGEAFGTSPPARSTVQVAALPLGAKVEIEAIAVLPNS
jgi:2-iminobutanoate/2-iminopropanoate deaminase